MKELHLPDMFVTMLDLSLPVEEVKFGRTESAFSFRDQTGTIRLQGLRPLDASFTATLPREAARTFFEGFIVGKPRRYEIIIKEMEDG